MSDYPFQIRGKVQKHDFGRMAFSVLYVPRSLEKQLPLQEFPRLRIEAEINGVRHNGALQPGGGRWFLMLSKRLQKLCQISLGDSVTVDFEIADQNAVDVPRELLHAIEADRRAEQLWDSLTTGKRRSLAHYVDSAKRPETREKRVEEVLELLPTL